jgi:YHS domain-containing protein
MMSDSRMVKDPICGKDVDTLRARAVGIFDGVTHYFCSAQCKERFGGKGATGAAAAPKKPVAAAAAAAAAEAETDAAAATGGGGELPVRYARSRIRRVTGEVGTPVVQIDLSPNKKPAVETSDEAPLEPARGGRGWTLLAIVMLLVAGGVIWFTLNHR